jgi:hypothetical protein
LQKLCPTQKRHNFAQLLLTNSRGLASGHTVYCRGIYPIIQGTPLNLDSQIELAWDITFAKASPYAVVARSRERSGALNNLSTSLSKVQVAEGSHRMCLNWELKETSGQTFKTIDVAAVLQR